MGALGGLNGTAGPIDMGSPALGYHDTLQMNSMNRNSSMSDWMKRVSHLPSVNAGLNPAPTPSAANIQNPVAGAVPGAQSGVGNSLASQNALLQALGNQKGIGNQSQVYGQGQDLYGQLSGLNGTGAQGAAMQGQGALAGQLGGAGGIQAQQTAMQGLQDVYGAQGQTMAQLQGIANGTGPNPAQAMLNQQTGQNVANQAALMAGQRGAGSNVGLMARQAAQQGAATQQQAVGQGASMQAQQSLGALGQMGAQQQAMGATAQGLAGIGAGLTAQQQAALAQQYGQGAGTVNQAQGQLSTNAGIAGNQVANTLGTANQQVQGNLGNQGQVLGSAGQYNADLVSGQGSVNAGNTALNTTAMQGRQAVTGGLLNSAGPVIQGLGSIFGGGAAAGGADAGGAAAGDAAGADAAAAAATAARGGYVQSHYAYGGSADQPDSGPSVVTAPTPVQGQGPQSSFAQFLAGNTAMKDQTPQNKLQTGTTNFVTSILPTAARGGLAGQGGGVKAKAPDQKATKSGNSYANDKVPALLSEGEIVLPRTVTQAADPVRAASVFVSRIMAKRKKGA